MKHIWKNPYIQTPNKKKSIHWKDTEKYKNRTKPQSEPSPTPIKLYDFISPIVEVKKK